ncbi:amino acid-binding protein [Nocardioides sp. GY 10113]|uniref:amino acid-binding protein n=1 Tax=Nocardioides sp. GY 10113 TaxID=2569761 RepID=UPI0010A786A8|nr:amino acid-binding protein [Nocardioides sp. GY 10113]TIC85045.1 amino acid-binding protein [Nocardioides sp. GY 10113]
MPFLMRVALPDVPGSLGRVATAIGMAGGDIEAIEIVEKRSDGTALDDVLLEIPQGTMPDTIVSACNVLDGVRVLWISHYPSGGTLVLDLEAVEELTASPGHALDRLVDLLPATFRADWGSRVHRAKGVVYGTSAAPDELEFLEIEGPERLEVPEDENTLYAAARLDGNEIVVIGRRGGPEFLDSELARLGHLCGLAVTIANAND